MSRRRPTPQPTTDRGGQWVRKLLLLAVALAATAAVLELGARLWLVHLAGEEAFTRYATFSQLRARYGEDLQGLRDARSLISHAHHRYLGYYPTPSYRRGANRHNALGYRGDEIPLPKPPGEFRIVCLGGSTTYSSTIEDYRQAYPYLLEQELRRAGQARVRVINAGAPGWSSWESLINLELRVLDLEPDLIVVYDAINDIDARLVWPPENYRGDNSGRRKPAATGVFMPPLAEYSTLLRTLAIRAGWALPHSAMQLTVDPGADTYHGDDFLAQHLAGTYPSGIFTQVTAFEMLERNPPIYFRRNLENIVALARAHGVVPVLATFAWSPGFEREPRTSSPEYNAAFVEMNGVVAEVAASRGVPLIDLAAAMPRDPRYWVDGQHMTIAGSELMARLVAAELLQAGVLPAAP